MGGRAEPSRVAPEVLDRFIRDVATAEDAAVLEQASVEGRVVVATGERAVALGGSADGAVIVTGDVAGNIIVRGASAELILKEMREALATAQERERRRVADAEAQQHAMAVKDYLHALRVACEQLPYAGLRLRERPVPRLSEVYVEQLPEENAHEVAADSHKLADSAGVATVTKRTAPRAENLRSALQHHPHLTLEGGPGLGKSTLLHHLALSLIDDAVDPVDGLVPVLVRARGLAGWKESLSSSLRAEVTQELSQYLDRELPPAFFATPPVSGATWLVLIDGLDEIVSVRARGEFIEKIRSQMMKPVSIYRFVVSSRPAPDVDLLGRAIGASYVVPPFEPEQVETFVRNWFMAWSGTEENVTEFLGLVEGSRIAELAQMPLLLTMAALVYEQNRASMLPESRAGLYRSFVDILLESKDWDGYVEEWRVHHRSAGEQAAEGLVANLRQILEHLALWQHEGNLGPLVDELTSYAGARGWAQQEFDVAWLRQQLSILLLRTGVLVERGDDYAFLHETFREYLAAAALAAEHRPDQPETCQVIDKWRDEHWRQVILLLIGIWSDGRQNVSQLLRAVWPGPASGALRDRSALSFVGTALAEGARVDEQFASVIIDGLAVAAQNASWGSRFPPKDWFLILGRLRGHPHAPEVLRSLSNGQRLDASDRVRAAGALGELGRRDEAVQLLQAWANVPSMGGSVRAQVADTLRMLGRRGDAIELLQAWGADLALSRSDRIRMAAALGKLGRRDNALRLLQSLATDSALDESDQIQMAEALGDLGRRDEAVQLLQKLADSDLDGSIWLRMPGALRKLGRTDEATGLLQKLATDPALGVLQHVQVARELGELGRREEAVELLRKLTAPALGGYERVWAARVLGELGQEDEAIGLLRAWVTDPALNGLGRAWAADALGKFGQEEEALCLLRTWASDPALGILDRVRVADAFGNFGRKEEAIDLLRAWAADPTLWVWDRMQAAEALGEFGWKNEAGDLLREMAVDSAMGPLERVQLTEALRKLGRESEAIGLLQAWATDPALSVLNRMEAAEALGERGHRDEAVGLLRKLVADPALGIFDWVSLARAFGKLGYNDEAIDLLRAWATDTARWGFERRHAAEILGKLGREDEAIALLQAGATNPELGVLDRVEAAEALGERGRTDEAAELLRAWATDPSLNAFDRVRAAEALGKLGREDEAIALLRAWATGPSVNPFDRVRVTEALRKLGREDEAIALLRAWAIDPSLNAFDRVRAAEEIRKVGYDDEAISLLQKLAADPMLNGFERAQAARALGPLGGVGRLGFLRRLFGLLVRSHPRSHT